MSNPNLHPLSQSSLSPTHHKILKLALFNTRSLNNKALVLHEFITDNNLDFLFITETWHKHLDYFSLNQATPPGYTYIDKPRLTSRGGGVALVHKTEFKISTISTSPTESFEHITLKFLGPSPLVFAVIYRPAKFNPSFFSDFSDFVTQLPPISPFTLLLGDFNFHLDNTNCKHASEFLDLLDCLNFTQHVNFPAHTHGHTLD
ncbi:uncharacterized protein LOC109521672 [Hippocampus comes]|uniref:uncharacterized protein LOC109521672 n=1 Tax=Hippocampus comes TaxID=109280 RepID=UPI00094E049C|nr:PREDICTED: uncharacterized protein LOC109521672 [Hippocampus comes]